MQLAEWTHLIIQDDPISLFQGDISENLLEQPKQSTDRHFFGILASEDLYSPGYLRLGWFLLPFCS